MFAFSTILGRLSWNILDILGHDVKLCDQNLPYSQYFSCFLTNFACICIVWDVAKIHARCMWFGFHLVTFTNVPTYILILFFHINQHLMVALNVFYKIWAFVFASVAFMNASCMPIVEWQHLVLAQDTLLGMQPIVHVVHRVTMSPFKVVFTLRPFPFANAS